MSSVDHLCTSEDGEGVTDSLAHSLRSPLSRNDSHSFRGDCRYALLGRFTDLLRSGSDPSKNFFLVA